MGRRRTAPRHVTGSGAAARTEQIESRAGAWARQTALSGRALRSPASNRRSTPRQVGDQRSERRMQGAGARLWRLGTMRFCFHAPHLPSCPRASLPGQHTRRSDAWHIDMRSYQAVTRAISHREGIRSVRAEGAAWMTKSANVGICSPPCFHVFLYSTFSVGSPMATDTAHSPGRSNTTIRSSHSPFWSLLDQGSAVSGREARCTKTIRERLQASSGERRRGGAGSSAASKKSQAQRMGQ
jgi:hypothetical protein